MTPCLDCGAPLDADGNCERCLFEFINANRSQMDVDLEQLAEMEARIDEENRSGEP